MRYRIVRLNTGQPPAVWYELHDISPDGDFVQVQRISARDAARHLWNCEGTIEVMRTSVEQLQQWTADMLSTN